MNYEDFEELEPYDLIVPNRGKWKGVIFYVDFVDEDSENVKATWSDMNDEPEPNPLPSVYFGRHSIDRID